MGQIVHRSSSLVVMMAAASLMMALPGVANACRLGPLSSEAQRAADIQQRQAEAWERSPLVFLAAVTEVVSIPQSDQPFGRVQIALTSLVILKGDGRPGDFDVIYPGLDRRCGRDFFDLAEGAQIDDLFVVYASTPEPSSADDIWGQAWLDVRDPMAVRAASARGWDQAHGRPADKETGE